MALKRDDKAKNKNNDNGHDDSLLTKASKVFTRVPTLKALFFEILACQGLSTLLNVCFVTALKSEVPNDDDRAGWMGKVRLSFFSFHETQNFFSVLVRLSQ